MQYPQTRQCDQVDDYFGTSVPDPYRWLEDDQSEETGAWVQEQRNLTQKYLETLGNRDKIRCRTEELFNYERVSSPRREGPWMFYQKNSGLQNQNVIYVKHEGEGGQVEEVFLDPNQLSEDGTTTFDLLEASDDFRYMTVAVSEAGSDWRTIYVYEIATKQQTGDCIRWAKFTGATWYQNGFFYSRFPEPEPGQEFSAQNSGCQVYYHQVGTPQSEDRPVYGTGDPEDRLTYNVEVTEDKEYLILYSRPGCDGYECRYRRVDDWSCEFTTLFSGYKNKSSVIDHLDGYFFVHTDIGAPNYRLVKVPVNAIDGTITSTGADPSLLIEVIPERESLLEEVTTCGGELFLHYLERAQTKIYQISLTTLVSGVVEEPQELVLPAQNGTAGGFSGRRSERTTYFTYSSFTQPTSIYKYKMDESNGLDNHNGGGYIEVFYQPELKYNVNQYESKQVVYPSKDGTEVTMFLVYRKDLDLRSGRNPTYLYGYGGFNISLTPSYSPGLMVFLEQGGIVAIPNLRGGGEYGENWHRGGMLEKKQNVFDDFIAAAEYLIANGYTSPEHLGIGGGSNGGLLVGACMTQRPELFRVALPEVGVLDMLRFHHFTIGRHWATEYGCADNSEAEFRTLYAYSPLHNLKEGVVYPATMILTADHDDRVVPAHSFKFGARLQEVLRCIGDPMSSASRPALLRIEVSAGHGAGVPISKTILKTADKWAFFWGNLGSPITPSSKSINN